MKQFNFQKLTTELGTKRFFQLNFKQSVLLNFTTELGTVRFFKKLGTKFTSELGTIRCFLNYIYAYQLLIVTLLVLHLLPSSHKFTNQAVQLYLAARPEVHSEPSRHLYKKMVQHALLQVPMHCFYTFWH